ncbi:HEXXH motif domain-containing protein [Streptomyces spiroverticillatus]|uniref:HEXXH motif domain-containing protein n=1 Tax=Streptomyces finlayi TaxID=67296 RepID=A0A918WSB5_9ACTN|nr:HEXXH motif-containing putative peptide modification protein [Streptomyces finlayi]GGZ86454.1 HEXXH motif domain-containing protein [Streptomyces spiroverticillatus]GHC77990.1 HEXXH motif domain-containing protein [Streptomyces finlayi]
MSDTEHHRLPLRTLTAVATGEVDASDVALLTAARRSRTLLALVGAYELTPALDRLPNDWPRTGLPPTLPRTAWKLLCAVQRADPAAADAVLADPMVGGRALQLLRRISHGAKSSGPDVPLRAEAGLAGSLAAAAAIRSGTRCSLRVPAHRGRLWLPSLGLTGRVARGEWAVVGVECTERETVVFGDSGSVRLPGALHLPSEGWHPLPGVELPGGSGTVTLDHLSPQRDYRSLLDPAPLPPDELDRWRQLLADASELLRADHPPAHRLVWGAVRCLVPAAATSTHPVSATAPDTFGAVVMSLPPDAPTAAATLVHEAHHQLLAAVDDLTPLLDQGRPGPEPLHFAPWRRDPRPLRGLVYGTHATAGITAFWHRRRTPGDDRAAFEFAYHRWQLRVALTALHSSDRLTLAGAHLVSALDGQAAPWWPERVAELPGALAAQCCADLVASWRAAHLAVAETDADALARRWLAGEPPPAVLPPVRLVPARAQSRVLSRLWLTRLWLTDRPAFDRLRAELEAGTSDLWGAGELTVADAALVAGDREEARGLFLKAADPLSTPVNVSDWVGLGLVHDETPPGNLLLERPELVVAVHAALLRAGTHPPGPHELARWFAPPGPGGAGSHAERVDVAVGP